MKEKEFQALISLLEDDDPDVAIHVEHRILEMGTEVVGRLEQAWEQESNADIQGRIEDIIYRLQSQETTVDLLEWRKSGGSDLLYGWFLVSKYQYPGIEFDVYKNAVNRLVNHVWLKFRRDMNIPQKLATINQVLFDQEEFSPNEEDVYSVENYFLNTVVDTKNGSPISLGILYIVICNQLDIPMYGVILPNYFVLLYKDNYNAFYIDIFNKGNFFDKNDLKAFLEEINSDEPKYYKPSSKIYIILELIRVTAYCYEQNEQLPKARSMNRLLDGIKIDFN